MGKAYMNGQDESIRAQEANHRPLNNDARYLFYKMLVPEKNISLVKGQDGRTYVQKEYKTYDISVFHQLQKSDIKGIPRIIEMEEWKQKLILVEEFIAGKNLEQMLAEHGVFEEKETEVICLQLCDILEQLHSQTPQILHRDIKPSNIMKKKNGEVVLLDFNAARVASKGKTEDTRLFGTQYFAAPEQLLGYGSSDVTTDIFGLGATMKYLTTGILQYDVPAVGGLGLIWSKCMSMDKKNRFQSIAELRSAILEVEEKL
jgi:serine/threonine protein kinase